MNHCSGSPRRAGAARLRQLLSHGSLALIGSIATLVPPGTAHGAEEVWVGTTSGFWSAGNNWLDGSAPTASGASDLSLRFTNASGAPVTATNDLGFAFRANELLFDNAAGMAVNATSSSGFELGELNPKILVLRSGAVEISSQLRLNPASGSTTVGGSGFGSLTLSGRNLHVRDRPGLLSSGYAWSEGNLILDGVISGSGGLHVTGSLNRTITLANANTYTGDTILSGGSTVIPSDAALGNGGSLIFRGGKLTLSADWVSSRRITSEYGGIIDTAGFNATLTGSLISPYFWTFEKTGAGTLRLASAEPYALGLSVSGGSVELSGGASLQNNQAGFHVSNGAAVAIDNRATPISERLAGQRLSLSNGDVTVLGHATVAVAERAGSVELREGSNTITLQAQGNAPVTLSVAGFSAGSESSGDLLVQGNNLGSQTKVILQAAPAALRGGIIPNIFASSNVSGIASSFATWDASTGVRALYPSQMSGGSLIRNSANGGSIPAGAHFLATGPTMASGTNNTIGTLTLEGAGMLSLAAGQRLTIAAGGVLIRPGTSAAVVTGGTIDFGQNQGVFYAGADLRITSTVTGSGGVRKTGPGTLTFEGTSAWTFPLYDQVDLSRQAALIVSDGILRVGPGNPLAQQSVLVQNGGTFDLNNQPTKVVALRGTGAVTLGSGTLTMGSSDIGRLSDFRGTITGSGGLVLTGHTWLHGNNTFSGGVVLESGRLDLGGQRPLGTGTFSVKGGSIREGTINNPTILHADVGIEGETVFGPQAPISGGRGLRIGLDGSLSVESASTYTGETQIIGTDGYYSPEPAIWIRGAQGSIAASSRIRIIAGRSMLIDNSTPFAGTAGGRVGDTVPIHIEGGTLRLSGNDLTETAEKVGAIRGSGFSLVEIDSASSQSTRLEAESFDRTARGTFLVRGHRIGESPGLAIANVMLAKAPVDLVGGSETGPETSILPYVVAMKAAGDSFEANLATYSTETGVRPLAADEYESNLANTRPTYNIRLSSAVTNEASLTLNSLVLTSNASLDGNGTLNIVSGTLLFSGNSTGKVSNHLELGAAEAQIYAMYGNAVLNGSISGTGGLTKSGSAALTLSGANTFSGPVTINSGPLFFQSEANLGTGAAPIVLSGQYSQLWYTGTMPLTLNRPIEVRGMDSGVGGYSAGPLTLAGGLSGAGSLILSGGAVTLTAPSTFTGNLTIGTRVSFNDPANVGTEDVTLDFGYGGGGALVYTGETPAALRAPLQVGPNGRIEGGVAGLNVAGPISGYGSLSFAGRVTLSADSPDYRGSLGLAASPESILTVNGHVTGGSGGGVAVRGGATLQGDGMLQQTVSVFAGSTLAPGDGIGTLRLGSLYLGDGSQLSLQIGSVSAFDQVDVRGTVALAGTITLSLSLGFDPQDWVDSFVVISNDGTDPITRTGGFAIDGRLLGEGDRFNTGGQEWRITYRGGSDANDVVLSAVPEPATLASLTLAATLLFSRRRTQREI